MDLGTAMECCTAVGLGSLILWGLSHSSENNMYVFAQRKFNRLMGLQLASIL